MMILLRCDVSGNYSWNGKQIASCDTIVLARVGGAEIFLRTYGTMRDNKGEMSVVDALNR
jgi:hypothetical protein